MRPRAMTPRRAEVLSYLIERYEGGYPPTLRELMAHFGWRSTNAPTELLRKLQRYGFIELCRGGKKLTPRGIRILRRPDGCPYVPCAGDEHQRARLLRGALPTRWTTTSGDELRAVVWGQPVRDALDALDAPRTQAIEQLQRLLAGTEIR